MAHSPFIRRTALTIAVVGIALACQSTDLAAPARHVAPSRASTSSDQGGERGWESNENDNNGEGHSYGRRPKPVTCTPHAVAIGSGRFGPDGGVLVVGDSRLFIPGGALRDTVTITGTALGDGTSTIHFEPEGLHFQKPVGLALSGAGCALPSEGMPSIVYLDDDGTIAETIPAVYVPRYKVVAAPIQHFSGYAIAF